MNWLLSLFLAINLLFAGCNLQENSPSYIISGLTYERDPETNLCFAYRWNGSMECGPSPTWVPCTDKVLKVIREWEIEQTNQDLNSTSDAGSSVQGTSE